MHTMRLKAGGLPRTEGVIKEVLQSFISRRYARKTAGDIRIIDSTNEYQVNQLSIH